MDRPSLPPIDEPGKANVPLAIDALEALALRVHHDVAPIVAKRFGGVGLGKAIAEVSSGYTRERENLRRASTGRDALAARLAFFLPRDVVKSAELVRQAHARGATPKARTWRILDLGAGLGTTSLGIARYARASDLADHFEIVAVDEDEHALVILREVFASATDLSTRVETVRGDFTRHLAKESRTFDLVVAGLALNELAEPSRIDVCEGMLARTADDGLVMIVEPALASTTRALMTLRDALVTKGAAHVVFPCTHAGKCPMLEGARDWCHVDVPISLGEEAARLARAASLRDERPTFAGLVLSRSPRPMNEGLFRVVSAPLGSKGRTEIHVCGRGGTQKLRQLDRHRKSVPVDIGTLRRGTLVELDGADPGQVAGIVVP